VWKEKKKIGTRKEKNKSEKIEFSQENAAENILQGGYQDCSDTMLWNMASIDEGEKSLWILSIDGKWNVTIWESWPTYGEVTPIYTSGTNTSGN
jgi:hypothetical protein